MSAKETDLIGAQPTDPPGWRLLFLLVQGRDGQWWRGFLLVALIALLLVGVLTAAFAGWAAGVLGAGSLTAALAAQRRRRRSRRR